MPNVPSDTRTRIPDSLNEDSWCARKGSSADEVLKHLSMWRRWNRLKLAQAVEGIDPLPRKAAVLGEFSRRFLDFLGLVGLVLECQLRFANLEKDASQGGRVETNPPRSENQTDARTRAIAQARR
jgi:hypothetical protein